MAKYTQVANLLSKRILLGDYAVKSVPAERQIAQEAGVSYMTARRAVQLLIEEGLLIRQSNGRVGVNRSKVGSSALKLAFLAPTFNSPDIERWRMAMEYAAGPSRTAIRPMFYMHWDDPLIVDALDGFDGVFLLQIPEVLPPRILERIRKSGRPLIILDDDLSHLALPSIRLFPPLFVERLLDHLATLGHRRIDCVNIQPENPIVQQRIEHWRLWMSAPARRCQGTLHSEPGDILGSPFQNGWRLMNRILESGKPLPTAFLCITAPAAVGAIRALHERGIVPGKDVSICTINGEGYAQVQIPSITALEAPDPTPYIAACLEWINSGGKNWIGPLLLQPAEVPLVIRESTQPVR